MSKNGPRRTLPCFLALHRREHCFGYFGSEKNEGESSLATKTLYECHSCANPERRIVLEVAEARRAGPKSHLYVSDRFAYCNGMDEGEELILEEVVSATMCDRVVIEPATTNDFEILQCSRGRVELVFLDQLRFVAKGMHFPIWVEQSVCIVFRALSVEPPMSGHVVRLTTNTEVEISVPSSMSRSDSALASPPVRASDQAMPGDILSSLSTDSPLDALLSHCDFPADEDSTSPEVFRVLFRRFFEERNEFGSHNVILSMSTEETGSVPKFQIVEVERESLQSGAIWIRIPVGVCSELYRRVKGVLADRKGHCIVSNNLRKAGFHDGFRIRVRPYSRKHCVLLSEVLVESCYEVNESTLTKSLQSHFESAIVSVTGFCLMDRHGLPLKLNVAGQIISVLLKPTSSCVSQGLSSTRRCFVFSTSKLPSFKYESVPKKEESTENESMKLVEHEMQSFGSRNSRSNCTPLMCQSFTIATLVSNVVFSLKEQSRGRAHYLLTGARLSGKSTHLRLLAVELERHPMTVFSKFIDCRSWKGKSAETIEKRLNADIGHLKQRQPALLLLDNIDFFSLKNEGEERVIAMEKFFFTIRDVIEKSGILMCATARSTHSVNKILTRSQGKRFFGNTFVIAPPDQRERCDLLTTLCPLLERDEDVAEVVKRMENFVIGDMRRVVDRAKIEASMNGRIEEVCVDDLRAALEGYRPISVEISKADAGGEVKVDWNAVGGMSHIKQLLSEVLLWPSKYASLFERCGLCLGRGVMLHGPSGCGKTLIAQATATESKMNFVQVKGPELLSKYIGASEENVRNVFARARSSRPCLVFFDEFDALAPRRGHDSTGVTDRVVNQLLTELDGADQLEGVFVIAATSRLDLIDPALLRPGRFDHVVECGYPTLEERKEILRIVCSNVHVESPKILMQLARDTEGWTGAQLRGLITNAQFDALRENPKYVDGMVVIRKVDVEKSFEEVQKKQRAKTAKSVKMNGWQQEQRVTLA